MLMPDRLISTPIAPWDQPSARSGGAGVQDPVDTEGTVALARARLDEGADDFAIGVEHTRLVESKIEGGCALSLGRP